MPTAHEENLLDSGIEESFPASDPVSVFVHLKQKPLPGEKFAKPIAWRGVALAAAPALLGLVSMGARMLGVRRAGLRAARRRTLTLGALGALVVTAAAGAAALRRGHATNAPGEPATSP